MLRIGVQGNRLTVPLDPSVRPGAKVDLWALGGNRFGYAKSVTHLASDEAGFTRVEVDRWRRVRWYHQLWWWLRDLLFGG